MLDGVKISAVSEDVIFLCCSVVGGTLPLVQGDPSIFLLEINLVAVSRNTGHISSGYTANTEPATYWCSCNLYTANTQPATYLKMLPEHWHWLPYAANTLNAIFKIPISESLFWDIMYITLYFEKGFTVCDQEQVLSV